MRKYDLTIRFFWLALGLFVVIYSYTLGLGKLIDPGPGLLPFLLGSDLSYPLLGQAHYGHTIKRG